MDQKDSVADSIREQLHTITTEGPFTIAKAMKIKRVAQASVALLRALSDGVADKAPDPNASIFECLTNDVEGGEPFGPIAPSNPAETYASSVIRDVVAALPRILAMQHQGPEELVRAIALAEMRGMGGLATKLRKQLGIEGPEEPTPPKPGFFDLVPAAAKTRADGEIQHDEPTLASDSEKGTDSPSAVLPVDACGHREIGCRKTKLKLLDDSTTGMSFDRVAFDADPSIPESLKLRPIT